ncbi:MAG: hypothetical protein ACRC5M_00380 [Anaeroplasmataceae bacterium]
MINKYTKAFILLAFLSFCTFPLLSCNDKTWLFSHSIKYETIYKRTNKILNDNENLILNETYIMNIKITTNNITAPEDRLKIIIDLSENIYNSIVIDSEYKELYKIDNSNNSGSYVLIYNFPLIHGYVRYYDIKLEFTPRIIQKTYINLSLKSSYDDFYIEGKDLEINFSKNVGV